MAVFGLTSRITSTPWQALVEVLLNLAVEAVHVHVREHNEVCRRQRLQFECRISPAGRRHAVPEMDVVAPVKEVRVGEDREPRVAEDHVRRADKENRPLGPIGRGHVGARQAQLIGGIHFRSALSVMSGARCSNREVDLIVSIRSRHPCLRPEPLLSGGAATPASGNTATKGFSSKRRARSLSCQRMCCVATANRPDPQEPGSHEDFWFALSGRVKLLNISGSRR
jgi:hypothetical protein